VAKLNPVRRTESPPRPSPTEEQNAILSKVKTSNANLIINALAGTGKTTTLEMVQSISQQQPILYLAFNKKVADEAKEKFSSTTMVKTLNGAGHAAWAKGRNILLDPQKTKTLFRQMIEAAPKAVRGPMWDSYNVVIDSVAMAKALGYIPKGIYDHITPLCSPEELYVHLDEKPDELTQGLIDTVLKESIRTAYAGYIDFNDQLYMPTLFGGSWPRFPLVMADEAQDFSPLNLAMLDKLCRGRLIAVGDPWQSIYAFRGADIRSMARIDGKFQCESSTLSLCFRCPKPIVEAARFRAPELRWIKEEGTYEILKDLTISSVPENATFLCRNNAPLYQLAMRFLQAGRGVSVAGSEIGPKIIRIMQKLGPTELSIAQTVSAIEDWRNSPTRAESKATQDIAECMKVFAGFGRTLGLAIAHAERLFREQGSIYFSTGHKAKGMEWDTVYHLDPWLCQQDDQDQNLRYVITTRAKQSLYEIDSARIK
jgi:DNA helicase II / ATP-dependent DNA helicase PcrA